MCWEARPNFPALEPHTELAAAGPGVYFRGPSGMVPVGEFSVRKDLSLAQNPAADPVPPEVTITFEDKPLVCRPDTSLAVALWDHGIRHLSHSHKYGRPRGVTCARGHCTNCLLRVDGVPNVRSCEMPVRDGMVVASQDTGAFYGAPMQKMLSLGSAWLPVGFYYKWFTKPASLSRFFLNRIRPLTGVGRLPDPVTSPIDLPAAGTAAGSRISSQSDLGHFETIIVGGGPSGLRAARSQPGPALLIDDCATVGGQRLAALRELAAHHDSPLARFPSLATALNRLEQAVAELPAADQMRFMGGCKAVAGYYPNGLLLRQGDNLQTARFNNLVWEAASTGASDLREFIKRLAADASA